MTSALQAQAGVALHGRTHLMLALRGDGDPDSEARRREWSIRATEAGVSVMGEISDAAYALAALHAYERFRHSRGVVLASSPLSENDQ
jgi:hypothetical protein